jgi:hypothetical protein
VGSTAEESTCKTVEAGEFDSSELLHATMLVNFHTSCCMSQDAAEPHLLPPPLLDSSPWISFVDALGGTPAMQQLQEVADMQSRVKHAHSSTAMADAGGSEESPDCCTPPAAAAAAAAAAATAALLLLCPLLLLLLLLACSLSLRRCSLLLLIVAMLTSHDPVCT